MSECVLSEVMKSFVGWGAMIRGWNMRQPSEHMDMAMAGQGSYGT